MTKDQILKRFKEIDIIYREPTKFFPRTKDNFYCDIKKTYGYPDILNTLVNLIGEKLQDGENCIAVSGYGGLPLGAMVASKFNRKLIMVRKKEKKFGPRGLIDGYTPTENDTVVILDDVLATGKTILPFIDSLQKTKAKISRAIIVVELEKMKLPISHEFLFSIDEILKSV